MPKTNSRDMQIINKILEEIKVIESIVNNN